MKRININDFKNKIALNPTEVLAVEKDGETLGYFYPVTNEAKVQKAKKELDEIMEKVLQETGLSEEEMVKLFTETKDFQCA